MATYVYVSRDFGASWQSLAGEGVEGFAHIVRQDPVDPDLLYLGTEFGLYLSIDGGGEWARFTGNLPRVAVHDLDVRPREHDLILATHGRGLYIIDDITPLRQLDPEVLAANVTLLEPSPAVMRTRGGVQVFSADDEFLGFNPPEAAAIDFYLKKRHLFGDLKIEIYDAAGELVSTVPGGKRKGLNRAYWPMRLKPPKLPPSTALAPGVLGPRLPEGAYTVKLIKGDTVQTGSVELVADPRSPHTREDRALQQRLALELYRLLDRLTYTVESVTTLRDQAQERRRRPQG